VLGSETAHSSPIIRHKEALAGFKPRIDPAKATVLEHYRETVQRYWDRPFLGTRLRTSKGDLGPYMWKTWGETDALVLHLAAALKGLGLAGLSQGNPAYPTFGIMSPSCEEWVMVDLACQRQGITLIPLGDKVKPEDLRYMVKQTGVTTIACPLMCLKPVLRLKRGGAETVKNVILWENQVPEEALKQAESLGLRIFYLSQLITRFQPIPDSNPQPEDIYCICYTSGTTGKPKGVIITHAMFLAEAATLQGTVLDLRPVDIVYSYLPLQHIYERDMYSQVLVSGAAYAFSHGNPDEILEDMYLLRPTVCAMVPRVLNKIYDTMQAQIESLEPVHKELIRRVLNEKTTQRLLKHPSDFVFAQFRAQFGSSLRGMVSSSAPLRREVLNFFVSVLSSPLLECYGMTEVTGIAAMTQDLSVGPGVGSPTLNVEMKLVDLGELGYSSKANPPKGEICFRGPIKTPGYFLDPVRTKEAIDEEGWMHSGDVGELTPTGSFKIIDRVKHFFKLSQGIYIAPEKLENVYRLSRFVTQVFITGSSIRDYLVAIVVPDLAYLQQQFSDLPASSLCQSLKCRQAILTDILALAKKHAITSVMRPKQIFLDPQPFSIKNRLLNQTQKFMRHAAEVKYRDIVEQLYEEGPLSLEEYTLMGRPRL
jgi:long-chain acyl-CoA synthetase